MFLVVLLSREGKLGWRYGLVGGDRLAVFGHGGMALIVSRWLRGNAMDAVRDGGGIYTQHAAEHGHG